MGKLNFLALVMLALCGLVAKADNAETSRHAWIAKNWGLDSTKPSIALIQHAWPVRIAVVDTGVDESHPELLGVIDSKYKSFIIGDPLITDHNGHGTHVVGIIAAVANWNVKILPVKYFADYLTGPENLINSTAALKYAVDSKVNIINYSGGGSESSKEELTQLKRARDSGILVVVAAGNDHADVDSAKGGYYPCAYHLPNIICVAAYSTLGTRMKASNWGKKSVDLFAPGENILSLAPNGKFAYMSGTSQATAFVTGVAALVWSQDHSLTAAQVKKILMSSAFKSEGFKELSISGGSLNAVKAVRATQNKVFTSSHG